MSFSHWRVLPGSESHHPLATPFPQPAPAPPHPRKHTHNPYPSSPQPCPLLVVPFDAASNRPAIPSKKTSTAKIQQAVCAHGHRQLVVS
ncbi:hypothetical protein Bpfe_015681 [Biomphalaria pfeifferi]|uniref:Uncharacterized protein n=1 Tax=Biomphalaria pfeifferi TaxID=112525 RepID=A0AAD8BHS6_BIOPF|nr:hypothetical protein Bpfe_015681 [Biomphalaria pfeifferi]